MLVLWYYFFVFLGFTLIEKSSLDILLRSTKIIQHLNINRVFTHNFTQNTTNITDKASFTDYSVCQLILHISKVSAFKTNSSI